MPLATPARDNCQWRNSFADGRDLVVTSFQSAGGLPAQPGPHPEASFAGVRQGQEAEVLGGDAVH